MNFGVLFEENSLREILESLGPRRFRITSLSKCFASTLKRKAAFAIKFFRFEERFLKVLFS